MTDFNLYINNGLTAISNDSLITTRDGNGNVVIDPDISNNQKLIIETITEQYTKRSVINALDTQFRYFTFPATETVPELNVDINTDFSDILPSTDLVFARYSPATSYNISANATRPSGLEFSNVEIGVQPRPNSYLVSQELINRDVPLRFRVNLTVENQGTQAADLFVSVARTKPGGLIRNYIPGAVTNNTNSFFNELAILPNTSRTLEFDIIINQNQFERGTTFGIAALTNPGRTLAVVPAASYWVINDATQNVNEYNEPI